MKIRVLPPLGRPLPLDTCPRTDTVEKLADLLDDKHVIHVRGTPSSGKTTLASLLWMYYQERGHRVVFVPYWIDVKDPHEFLAQLCELAGITGVNSSNILSRDDIIFIVDEAQSSYGDNLFWLQIVKYQSDRHCGPKICLFASYGNPITGSPTTGQPNTGHETVQPRFTPVKLGPSQRVSLTVSKIATTPNVCLFYNQEEFDDVLKRLCSRSWSTCGLSSDAGSYLYSITDGHPGAVSSLMSYVYTVCVPYLRSSHLRY